MQAMVEALALAAAAANQRRLAAREVEVIHPGLVYFTLAYVESEHGTYKIVKARLWPWLSVQSPS